VPSLEQVGELAFIESIARLARGGRGRGVSVGIGDDAAVVATGKHSVLTTDTQREGTHFRRDWLTPEQLGRRAFRVAVSDLSAMAATAALRSAVVRRATGSRCETGA
jgi:thiamine-monophosphate kinase